MPTDVTFDPKNDKVLYVAGFEDHCIWKVEIIDLACNKVEISVREESRKFFSHSLFKKNCKVFAGDPAHSRGEADGVGHEARFDTPVSLIFDPICDCIYV